MRCGGHGRRGRLVRDELRVSHDLNKRWDWNATLLCPGLHIREGHKRATSFEVLQEHSFASSGHGGCSGHQERPKRSVRLREKAFPEAAKGCGAAAEHGRVSVAPATGIVLVRGPRSSDGSGFRQVEDTSSTDADDGLRSYASRHTSGGTRCLGAWAAAPIRRGYVEHLRGDAGAVQALGDATQSVPCTIATSLLREHEAVLDAPRQYQ
mmetsp:Transcript_33376/g.92158  ORF Transcript_33376/g.92158 Transcript_33376/m.92158 type:complete len:209 (-) Transcript_33376:89-715(-)